MQNIQLRVSIYDSGISYRKIAQKIGVTPEYLSRIMAKPLSEENRLRIMDALAQLEQESKEGNGEQSQWKDMEGYTKT